MKLPISDLQRFFTEFKEDPIPIKSLEKLVFLNKNNPSGEFIKIDTITPDNIQILVDNNVKDVFIEFSAPLLAKFCQLFPKKYKKPATFMPFRQIFNLEKTFYFINKKSRRKRHLICSQDVLNEKTDIKNPADKVLFNYNEEMTINKLVPIKRRLMMNEEIALRFSEVGIIIFVDMRGGEKFLERFYKNSDLVTSLVGHRQRNKDFTIATDLDPIHDIYTEEDPSSLLDTYLNTNARLIIVGDNPDEEYKNALRQVKEADPYVRLMIATHVDQSQLDDFLQQVKQAYDRDHWDINRYKEMPL